MNLTLADLPTLNAALNATSAVLLLVFLFVNVALILIKRQTPDAPFRVPVVIPWIGLAAALAALAAASGVLL